MPPYPTYKPSNIPWLGDVPAHWGQPRTKVVFRERVEKGFPQEPLLAATQQLGVVRKDRYDNRTVLALKDLHLLKRVHAGDFVISLRSFEGGIEYAHDRGIISPAYTIIKADQGYACNEYFAFLFKSAPYLENLRLHVTGIREGQNIDYVKLSRSRIPLPPLHEQRAIARYLDYMDRRIQRYIRAKERLIELLEEQKRAVINQAVTRGLDPDVQLKPSGVEWLGDVPAHWEVRRLKFLATKFGSGVTPRGGAAVYKETGVPLLRSQNVHFDGLRLDGVARIDPKLHDELSTSHVMAGDVLLNITGASIGRTCAVPEGFKDGNVNQHVCIIRPRRDVISSAFLTAFLSTSFIQRRIRNELGGASREGLTLQSIRDFEVLVPPLDEQHRITDYIRERSSESLGMCNRTLKQIELIREYRTRLIADVVTGKLDVREAVAGLPEDDGDEIAVDVEDVLEDAV